MTRSAGLGKMQVIEEHAADPDGSPGTTPRVSVIVTTYRTPAPLLAASLASALHQTEQDLEVVLVLDGTIQPAEQAVVDAAASDERVVVLSPGRVGRGRALNLGLRAARAPVVAIQDADDESHPDRLAHQLAVLDHRPDIDLLATGVRQTRRLEAHADWDLGADHGPVRLVDRELLVRNALVHSSVVMRRDLVNEVAGYSVGRTRHFDYDLYLRVRDAGGTIAILDEPLVLKRIHDRQGFERDAAIVQRVWTTYKLQLAHAWEEPARHRVQVCALVTLRQGGHLVRALIRRRRASMRSRAR